MLGKRKRVEPEGASPGTKLRSNIVDLYAKGTVNAQRCASLLQDAGDSNVSSCQLSHGTSRARDLQRGLLKHTGWPPLYVCQTPVKDRSGELTTADVAYLLPHEVLYTLVQLGDRDYLCSKEGSGMTLPIHP